ncbi:hypothetical protein GCK72_003618 [Caenorhabditis remanei]|uniref:Uncharacterized protein n=1 Tax=Caenorhabditis remanei TaxID=31234 RepID=A0A6A5HB57_CAERE|nr:hypothetical protein GCK72_003618 [Caenorhabditis remanei]KAF1763673.1 hypothetical protein GCK72_003618 [Caenorhabditis remanei]
MTLTGSGLRIGSIRNVFGMKTIEYSSPSTTDFNEYNDLEKEEDEIDFDFSFMDSNCVKVFKIYDEEKIRLEVELTVQSTKTTGNSCFNKKTFGFSYPTANASGGEDWYPNTAVSLLFLSVIAGNTKIEDILSSEKASRKTLISTELADPPPLFCAATTEYGLINRESLSNVTTPLSFVARMLELPPPLFTSKSCRRGYAKGIVEAYITRKGLNDVATSNEINECLNTGARWKSSQSKVYTADISDCVVGGARSDVGIGVVDWMNAIYRCSPWTKEFDSDFITLENLDRTLEKNGHTVDTNGMNHHERTRLINVLNVSRWNAASQKYLTIEEMGVIHKSRPKLDLRKTLHSLSEFLESRQLCFNGTIPINTCGSIRCPIVTCTSPVMSTQSESDIHWDKHHKKSHRTEQYQCQLCENGKITKFRYFRQHILKKHPTQPKSFYWFFEQDIPAENTLSSPEVQSSS